ncbi:BnaCnng22490D [Brassica napus]|uniref:BnaCnng22490D protein n=1 Tax=Brassica napus TaxID=3708 RepID=A0A078IR62_BRANA|nr:BnaCnng22490D [Brassica napus]
MGEEKSVNNYDIHNRFKELCLENDNPEAHYIEGILQYFVHKEKRKGLYHLRQASIGKKYLDKLQWKENLSTSDYCWKRVKKTLSTIPAIMETRYYRAMVNLEPRTECHPDNMAEVCKHCYYSKRLTQFVQFAMNQDKNKQSCGDVLPKHACKITYVFYICDLSISFSFVRCYFVCFACIFI